MRIQTIIENLRGHITKSSFKVKKSLKPKAERGWQTVTCGPKAAFKAKIKVLFSLKHAFKKVLQMNDSKHQVKGIG